MTKESLPKGESKPVKNTGESDEAKTKPEAEVTTNQLPVEVRSNEPQEQNPTQSEDETDRKQDEAIDSLADQTEWIKKQTRWIAAQVIASSILSAVTLAVLIYHGWIMRAQSQAMSSQTEIMKGQLESMNSGSGQTERIIRANESLVGQNKELVAQAGEQTKASVAQADATRTQAQIAQQTFYIGERPYVGGKSAVIDKFEAGANPTITLEFENTGKTPAIDLQLGAIVSIDKAPRPDVAKYLRMTAAESSAIDRIINPYAFVLNGASPPSARSPNAPLLSGGAVPIRVRVGELTAKTVDDIKDGNQFLFVWGGAFYKDGLRKFHRLKFCLFYDPKEDSFVACPTFNSSE